MKYFNKKGEKKKKVVDLFHDAKKVSIPRSSQPRDNVLCIVPFIIWVERVPGRGSLARLHNKKMGMWYAREGYPPRK